MKKLLIVVDYQNDFVTGTLGTKEAVSIKDNVFNKVKNWDDDIIFTQDTHYGNYLETREGKYLPVEHCIIHTDGWDIVDGLVSAAVKREGKGKNGHIDIIDKTTFGSKHLPTHIRDTGYDYVELIGVCTDICVISNALLIKAFLQEIDITVDASCCAGVTPEKHKAALEVMKSCQINIINE